MPIYLLDTDHMTALYWGGEGAGRLRNRLRTVPQDDYGTTIISFDEQTRGWLSDIARLKTEQEIALGYDRLSDLLKLYLTFAVWQYSSEAATVFDALRKNGIRIGAPDLRIASIALATGAVVLTRNRKDFAKVPGLRIEDWTTNDA